MKTAPRHPLRGNQARLLGIARAGSHNAHARRAGNRSTSFVTHALARPPSRRFVKAGAHAQNPERNVPSVVATMSVARTFAGGTPAATHLASRAFNTWVLMQTEPAFVTPP